MEIKSKVPIKISGVLLPSILPSVGGKAMFAALATIVCLFLTAGGLYVFMKNKTNILVRVIGGGAVAVGVLGALWANTVLSI
ncbi:hypothetical protein ACFVVQ_14970 [Paenibacillus chitinolyticus]|uniref:hypothetical protein n=1 Tax=Paenibacillus chitinolyticus TaxID=79263 RepID=UPI0036DBD42B